MKGILTVVLTTFLVFGCASKMSIADKNVAYADFISANNLQDINRIRSFSFSGWTSLTDDYMILTANVRKDYLLKMRRGCLGLSLANSIELHQFSDSTFDKLGDAVAFKDMNPMRCKVDAIYPLTREQSKAIKQIGREKPQK